MCKSKKTPSEGELRRKRTPLLTEQAKGEEGRGREAEHKRIEAKKKAGCFPAFFFSYLFPFILLCALQNIWRLEAPVASSP